MLYLQEHSADPFRDVILNACLHNMALDRQVEGSRAAYMLDIIEQTGESKYYREQILSTLRQLPPELEDYDIEQLFDFARLFAIQGNQEARQAIYNKFILNLSSEDFTGAATIIELDGIKGFLFVASHLGEFALHDPDFVDDDLFLIMAEEQSGQENVSHALAQVQTDDPRIAAYMRVVSNSRARRERWRAESRTNPSTLSFSEIENSIYSRKTTFARLSTWGQHASESDLLRAARKVQTESDPNSLRRFLGIFRYVRFPLDHQLLFALSQHADEQVAIHALNALVIITHPEVRAFALDMISMSFRPESFIRLLAKNFQDGDWEFVEHITQQEFGPEEFHRLGIGVRAIFAEDPNIESIGALMNLYEKGQCANCRVSVVKCLHKLNAIPQWMVQECRRDANFYLRECANKNFEGLGPNW